MDMIAYRGVNMDIRKEKLSIKNQSAVKALDIIEILADNIEPMRLQDIAGQLGMNTSTVLRFLVSLDSCGYVRQNKENLKYQLTFKICSIANKVSENIHLNDLAQPYMKNIAGRFGESVCLALEQDMSVVYIGVLQLPGQMLRSTQRVGNRAPLHCTGTGKLMLVNHDEIYLDALIAGQGLTRLTPNTIIDKQGLQAELAAVRQQGYALDREECEIGSNCLAAPIRDFTGKIIAAISVTGPTTRLTEAKMRENIDFILEQAADLSQLLGFESANESSEEQSERGGIS